MNRRNFLARLAGTLAALCGARAAKPCRRSVARLKADWDALYRGPASAGDVIVSQPMTLTCKTLTARVPIAWELLQAGAVTPDEARAIFPAETKRA